MKTSTIGFYREDGDFQILATLNNNDDLITREQFNEINNRVCAMLTKYTEEYIICFERQDTPDYISLD